MANAYVWSLPTIAENDATACSVSMELNSQDSGVCMFFFLKKWIKEVVF